MPGFAAGKTLTQQIIGLGEKHQLDQLRKLLESQSTAVLTELLNERLSSSDCIAFWNYLLQGFDAANYEARGKRFALVKVFLDGLLKIELTYKQMYDLVTRLCQDLYTFPHEQLIEILEHCLDGLRLGDMKCLGWKDLLPQVLKELTGQPQLNVNGVPMTGTEYRNNIVRNLYTMRWPIAVLTPIADMLKELKLTSSELSIVLSKFANDLHMLAPTELPALAYQLFSMCATAAQIIIPLLAFDKYFHNYYYRKLFADMHSNTSDFDSIDKFSDKELCEAEETILHHLNYCTQYTISEIQLFLVLKNFTSLPDVILTPFMISAILSMTVANREPDSLLNSSPVLTLLRSAIKYNEHENELAEASVWCRDCMHRRQVDIEQIFTVLIDRNKEGKEIITTGLVKLAFVLLRAKGSTALNNIAISFLTKFVRKRHVFGKGIVKKLCNWMLLEPEQLQYGECLTLVSIANTLTVSECVDTIKYLMDFFLWVPGEQAMHMMSFVLLTLKMSSIVRDSMCDILRQAMNSCELHTRRMAVYGFCMILKQLNNSNSQRTLMSASGNIAGICTQHSLSGSAMISQLTLGSRNNPQRHFDLLTLEIIGVLRKCFTQPLEIKATLYENLQRAVELNPKLVPHILQFIDWHFRSYFRAPPAQGDANEDANMEEEVADVVEVQPFGINFKHLVRALDEEERQLEVCDNLGLLIAFVTHCLIIFGDLASNDYDTREMTRLLDMSVDKLIEKEFVLEQMASGQLTHYKFAMLMQQMNFIEGLMAYKLLTAQKANDNVQQLLPLYRVHKKVYDHLKTLSTAARKAGNKKPKGDSSQADNSTPNVTINGVAVRARPQLTDLTNVWDLTVLERMLRLLHEDVVPFAKSEHANNLRASVELVNYVLRVTALKIAGLRDEPAYKQVAHSRRMLKYLTDVTKVLYERCIKRLPELWRKFDVGSAALAADCFHECVLSAHTLYRRKFSDVFVKGFDYTAANRCSDAPAVLQENIDAYMNEVAAEDTSDSAEELRGRKEAPRIPLALLQSLEVLYDNIAFSNRHTTESYAWLLRFCKTYELPNAELGIVHRLLFRQRQKTHSGIFYNTVAAHLRKVLGGVRDSGGDGDDDASVTAVASSDSSNDELPFTLRTIDINCAESCLKHLYEALTKQLDDVDYFITKAQNLNYKISLTPAEQQEQCVSALNGLERAICSQLVCIAQALLQLSSVALPLGVCMDGMMRLLMQYYVCLKNLTKHFLGAATRNRLCAQTAKFDLLLHTMGKALPSNIYALIMYIEGNILQSDDGEQGSKKSKANVERAKVLREAKLIPKLIMCVENFNKHVIMLSKKTKSQLVGFLHFGTVRDFRVRTSALKEAIDRTFSHSSQIMVDTSAAHETNEEEEASLLARLEQESASIAEIAENESNGEPEKEQEEEEQNENRKTDDDASKATTSKSSAVKPILVAARKKPGPKSKSSDVPTTRQSPRRISVRAVADLMPSPESGASGEVLQHESNEDTNVQLLKNLDAINSKAKKRTLRDRPTPVITSSSLVPMHLQEAKRKATRAITATKRKKM